MPSHPRAAAASSAACAFLPFARSGGGLRRRFLQPLAPLALHACAAVFALSAPSGAAAQSQAAVPSAPASAASSAFPSAPVQQIVVTGNPLRSDELAVPVSTLSGDGLVLRRGSTLGETLDGLPGVSSSYFGPNADRPVIRGQDGDRIRVLSNAGASLDASALSNDHAVPIDPLAVERIEVLRGPAALLYGGSAVGGVVNTIDNRIPQRPVDGVFGTGEVRFGGPAHERGASALVESGGGAEGGLVVHADGFWRETSDLDVPDFRHPDEDGGSSRRSSVANSASRAYGGALGSSMVWNHGFLGISGDTYRNQYGTVAEEDVVIYMRRDRGAVSGEVRDIDSPIVTVRGQIAYTDYEHTEYEGGEVGTTFDTKGTDSRFEFEHRAVALGAGTLKGVFGVQTEFSRFSALGEEAFVPSTHSKQVSGFVYEELATTGGKLTFGARAEHVRVESAGDEGDTGEVHFGPAADRTFHPGSVAVGGLLDLAPQWQLTGNLAYTQRAPTFYELYADGLHIATAAYERGDPDAQLEKGGNLDVGLQWKESAKSKNRLRVGAYASRFSNYITLFRTGETAINPEDGGTLAVYEYAGVPARFWGFESEGGWRVIGGTAPLDLDVKFDYVRGTDRDSGEPLPRLSPFRATLGADWTVSQWTTRAEVQFAARQTRVPDDDIETPSYTLLNLSASRHIELGTASALFYLKATNLTDKLAYNAATISTVRVLSPLPGRGLMAGLRVAF